MDRELSWDKLAIATLNLRAGAHFIGTNGDMSLPTERGETHGNGAILAALTATTGVKPMIIGKPEPIIYRQALGLLNTPPSDHSHRRPPDTDILGAVRTGIRSLMVLSGVSSRADVEAADFGPTWIVPDIRDVTRMLLDLPA